MNIQKIKQCIKYYTRNYMPSNLYTKLYITYQKIFGDKNHAENNKKFAKFTKKGIYDFKLDGTEFKIFLDPNCGCVDYEIFASKCFEPGILNLFKKELKLTDTFLDIGANIGQHSMYAAHFCNKVISFEPIKRLYEQFNDSIFVNDILNIQTFNYALGNKKEELEIYSNEVNMGASSILVSENRKVEQIIKVLRLDDSYNEMCIDKIDFVKIDVEGYELNVLIGMEKLVQKYKPKILVEFTPYFYNKVDVSISKNLYDFLIENKYEIWDVGNMGEQYIKIESFNQIKDLDQTNLFCR